MSIATSRFEGMHRDFNVASESFTKIKDATDSVINSATDFLDVNLDPLMDLVDQLKDMKQDAVDEAMGAIEKATRFTDDMFGTFTDLASLPGDLVNGMLKDLIPDVNSSLLKGLTDIFKICKSNAGRGVGMKGKKFKPPSCSGLTMGTKNCSNTNTAGVLNGILGGIGGVIGGVADLFNKAVGVFDNLLKKIVSLASIGFSANLCGVFSALIDGVKDKSIITLAAGVLLNAEGKAGNIQAAFDIGKNLSGINVPSMFPSTISNIAENLKNPIGMVKNSIGQFSQAVTGTLESIDSKFLGSNLVPSIASLGAKNGAIGKALTWAGNDVRTTVDNLTQLVPSRPAMISSAYSSLKNDRYSGLTYDEFGVMG